MRILLGQRIAQRLAVDAKHFTSIKSLQTWIKHDPTDADEIPRCHAFVIAFNREFRALPPSPANSTRVAQDHFIDVHTEDVQTHATNDAEMTDALS